MVATNVNGASTDSAAVDCVDFNDPNASTSTNIPAVPPQTSGSKTNVRAALYGPEDVRIEEVLIGPPAPGEAQVQIKASGLCGSDLHYFLHARNGDFVHREPAVLGHEAAGVVTALGEGVSNLRVGERVAIEAGIHCGKCRLCNEGRYNLCPDMRYCSSAKSRPILHGTLQTYMNHPAHLLHALPPTVSFEHAALVEPLSVALHAARRAPPPPGGAVLVFGAGSMGVLQCALCRALGAGAVVVVDVNAERVRFAEEGGFVTGAHVLEKRKGDGGDGMERAKEVAGEVVEKFRSGTDGFDVVYECTGVESCVQTAIFAARPGGKVAIVGMGTTTASLPLSAAAFREVDLLGVMRSANAYTPLLALLGAGRLPGIDALVSARFPLRRVRDAFEAMRAGRWEGRMVMKVVVGEYE